MPQYPMVETIPCFYYTGRADFENLRTYLARFTRTAPKLQTDGSVYYYSGSGMYSTLHSGEWLVRLSVPYTEQMMHDGYMARVDWPEDFPASPSDEA